MSDWCVGLLCPLQRQRRERSVLNARLRALCAESMQKHPSYERSSPAESEQRFLSCGRSYFAISRVLMLFHSRGKKQNSGEKDMSLNGFMVMFEPLRILFAFTAKVQTI